MGDSMGNSMGDDTGDRPCIAIRGGGVYNSLDRPHSHVEKTYSLKYYTLCFVVEIV